MPTPTSPQLYAELYFAAQGAPAPPAPSQDSHQDDRSRLTLFEHLSVCIEFYRKCLARCSPYHRPHMEAALFPTQCDSLSWTRESLGTAFPEVHDSVGSEWASEYKLRSSPFLLRDLHAHLDRIHELLTVGMYIP